MKRRAKLTLANGRPSAKGQPELYDGGLFVDTQAFAGTVVLNGYSQGNERLFRLEMRVDLWDDELHAALEALLARHAPKLGVVE